MLLLAGILLLSGCDRASGITVSNAWARPAMQGENGAVYFLLENHSASADAITGISCEVADAVEIHKGKMEADVMKMAPVTSVPIDGNGSVEFAPGGYHVMLVSLKQDLKVGDEIDITLHFENYDDMTLKVPVKDQADGSMSDY
jgi:copper(I)-binding protein